MKLPVPQPASSTSPDSNPRPVRAAHIGSTSPASVKWEFNAFCIASSYSAGDNSPRSSSRTGA